MKKVISVEEMHCSACENRITKALNAEKLNFSVSLDDKTVTIDGCDHCVATAISTLEDLGFTPKLM